jgi:hypothetical protein
MSQFKILSSFIENIIGIKIVYCSPEQYDFYFSPIGDFDNSSTENRIIVKRNFDSEKDIASLAHELGHYLSMTSGYWSANNIRFLTKKEVNNFQDLKLMEKFLLFTEECRAWFFAYRILRNLKILSVKLFVSNMIKCLWSYFNGYFIHLGEP